MKKEFLVLSLLTIISFVLFYLIPFSEEEDPYLSSSKKVDNGGQIDKQISKNEFIETREQLIQLNFDVIRITPQGDTVMAGTTEPNIKIEIFDGQNKIDSVFSDPNGEWIWISDVPLANGLKRFSLKHTNKNGNIFTSDQNVIVYLEQNKTRSPTVLRYRESNIAYLELLNKEKLMNGIAFDFFDFSPSGELIISGRTLPNNLVKLYESDVIKSEELSDSDGVWKFNQNFNSSKDYKLKVTTLINNKEVNLNLPSPKDNLEFQARLNDQNKVIVEPGNSLWRIARKKLGGGVYYTEIYENNKKIIQNPDLIFPGQVFNLPNLIKRKFYE